MSILLLSEVRETDSPEVGPKAATLGRLLRAGFPVPGGFCVGVSEYRRQMRPGDPAFAVDGLETLPDAERRARLSELRARILDSPVDRGFFEELERHYATLAKGLVAVRSSATVEDLADASSAGVYKSFLGISSFSECVEAVKRCWASHWNEEAFAYRKARLSAAGGDAPHQAGGMAVLVQRQIPADAAGVIFTENPMGSPGKMLMEGSPGLGEGVVSSRVAPDRFVLDRRTLKPTPQVLHAGAAPCIGDAVVFRLAKLALRVERHLRSPQDIEWAVTGKDVFILQARPITARAEKEPPKSRQVWSNLNAGEVLPFPVSPMSHSLLNRCAERALILTLNKLGMDVGEIELISPIAGRAYMNLNLLAGIQRRLPGPFQIDLNQILGGDAGSSSDLDFDTLDIEDGSSVRFRWSRMLLRFPGLVRWALGGALQTGERVAASTNRRADEIQHWDLETFSPEQLARSISGAMDDVAGCAEGLGASLVAMRYYGALDHVCRRWFPQEHGLASRLAVVREEVDSAEAALALWRLARFANEHHPIRTAIWQESDLETLRERLRGAPQGKEFLREWEKYLRSHGHHAIGELDLMAPRWSEDPASLLLHLRSYLRGMGTTEAIPLDPVHIRQRRIQEAQAAAERCRKQLNPIRRIVFDFVLKSACRGALVRENMKSALIRLLTAIRKLMLEQGSRLVRENVFEDRSDIFFLTRGELASLLAQSPAAGTVDLIRVRRKESAENSRVRPPRLIIGEFRPELALHPDQPESAATGKSFQGLGVSPGTASGPARVITGDGSSEQILPGEILVAPYADPGWVLHFLQAAAIVVDLGGQLSHGSILARELGIPAVANTVDASRVIRTGQILEVDGTEGVVRIIA